MSPRRAFAVVKLWPDILVAEDEVIARLGRAARKLGLECFVIHPDGRVFGDEGHQITGDDVDFVLQLHFEAPKVFDCFSFVALWNPLRFYHEYQEGRYGRYSNNLLSHDDFLSCDAPGADNHVLRLISQDSTHLPPELRLYHSVAEPIIEPSLGARVLFYAGINWERVTKRRTRHGEILRLLDKSGRLRIYGPRIMHGERIWQGFESYVDELPFDGASVVTEIAAAGVSLVFSSDAHKASGVMSSRLFESLAAGAVIISDEHPFSRAHFGDSLLYVDLREPPNAVAAQVRRHLAWIDANPEAALKLAREAQAIFVREFTLDHCLADLYAELPARLARLEQAPGPVAPTPPLVFLLVRQFSRAVVLQHLASAACQRVPARFVLLADGGEAREHVPWLEAACAGAKVPVELRVLDWSSPGRERRPLGDALLFELQGVAPGTRVCVVSERDVLFRDHLALHCTDREMSSSCSAVILREGRGEGAYHYWACRTWEWLGASAEAVGSTARFVFPVPSSLSALGPFLSELDVKAVGFLAASSGTVREVRKATVAATPGDSLALASVAVEDHVFREGLPAVVVGDDAGRGPMIEVGAAFRAGLRENQDLVLRAAFDAVPLPVTVRRLSVAAFREAARVSAMLRRRVFSVGRA